MRKKIMAGAATTALMLALAVPMFGAGGAAAAPNENANPHASAGKITICHATSSETNPEVIITVSANSWGNGHSQHHDGADGVVSEEGCVHE